MNKKVIFCPVCGMASDSSFEKVSYQGRCFYFCSMQCRENFDNHPTLYVTGKPKAVRIKQRTMILRKAPDSQVSEQIIQQLTKLMGIYDVSINDKKLLIRYDLLQVTAEQIGLALMCTEASLNISWYRQLTQAWHYYYEEIELDNLAAPAMSCCNRPPIVKV